VSGAVIFATQDHLKGHPKMKLALVLMVAASLQVSHSRPAEDALEEAVEVFRREMDLPAHFDKRFVQDIFRAASCLPFIGGLAGGILSGVGLMPKDDTCSNSDRGRDRPDDLSGAGGGRWVDGQPDDGRKIYLDRSMELAPADYVRIVREVIDNNQEHEKCEEELTSSDFIRIVREVMEEDPSLFDKRQSLADLPVVGKVFNALSEIPIAGDLFKGIMTGVGLWQ